MTISPLGCPPWSAEHESHLTRTHDSYTTPRDATSAPAHRVLQYLDEKGRELEGESWWTAYEHALAEDTAIALLERNELAVDVGLARVCNSEAANALVARHGAGEGMQASVLEALLSNPLVVGGLFGPNKWLATKLSFIAKDAPLSAARAMLTNSALSHDILNDALSASDAFAGLDDQRLYYMVEYALQNPQIAKFRERDRDSEDYDMAGHETMRNVALALLTLPATPSFAWMLHSRLSNLDDDLHIPYNWDLDKLDGKGERKGEIAQATKPYLERVFSRWTGKGERDRDDESFGKLRQTIAEMVPRYEQGIEEWLLGYEDRFVRRGAYAGLSNFTVESMNAAYARDGQDFLFGAVRNARLYQSGDLPLAKSFYELVSRHGNESPGEYEPTAAYLYEEKFEELRKRAPDRFPPDPSDWSDWKPPMEPTFVADEESPPEEQRHQQVIRKLDELVVTMRAMDRGWAIWLTLALVALMAWKLL